MAAHPGLVNTPIYQHDGPRRRADLAWGPLLRLVAQDADHGALPVLFAAVADVPGDSFAGPRHLAHMRGGAELISRSAAAQDPGSGPPPLDRLRAAHRRPLSAGPGDPAR